MADRMARRRAVSSLSTIEERKLHAAQSLEDDPPCDSPGKMRSVSVDPAKWARPKAGTGPPTGKSPASLKVPRAPGSAGSKRRGSGGGTPSELDLESPNKVRRSPGGRLRMGEVTPGAGTASTGYTPLMKELSMLSSSSPGPESGFGPVIQVSGRRGKHLDDGPAPFSSASAPLHASRSLPAAVGAEAGAGIGRRLFKARGLRVLAVTWNLAGNLPPASISSIAPDEEFELFAIGTQECMVNCGSVQSFVTADKSKWERRLQATLGPGFVRLASRSLNAMHLAVFVRKELAPECTRVQVETVATGFLGLVGNKGGIAVKFALQDRTFCFINSHLAAHQSKVERRHGDWNKIESEISRRLGSPSGKVKASCRPPMGKIPSFSSTNASLADTSFSPGSAGSTPQSEKAAAPSNSSRAGSFFTNGLRRSSRRVVDSYTAPPPPGFTVTGGEKGCHAGGDAMAVEAVSNNAVPNAAGGAEAKWADEGQGKEGVADFTVWLGDLNYRIDLARSEVASALGEEALDTLAANDQLKKAQTEGRVAAGYREGPLSFPPTYKFDHGSDNYDSSDKARIPAWTDRILFRSRVRNHLELLSYQSCADVRSSDHRPVTALFEVSSVDPRPELRREATL